MIVGHPDKFKGVGLVAFIDILGFSKEIENNWDNRKANPLKKILNLKKHLPKHTIKNIKKYQQDSKHNRTYICRVQTISDSIIVSFGFEKEFIMGDFVLGMTAFFDTISVIWKNTIEVGFTIRGAVDFGKIYWDKKEIIGPAFIKAYRLEQSHAKTSRVILSSDFNKNLTNAYQTGNTLWDDHFLEFLRKDNDGYIILNPHKLYDNEEDKQYLIKCLTALKLGAKSFDCEKYSPILASLHAEKYNLFKSDLGKY